MGGRKGKSLTMKDLKKKMGTKSGNAKEQRKAAAQGAKKGRVKLDPGVNPLAEVKMIHPNSRKAKQLMRSFTKEARKQQHQTKLSALQKGKMERLRWFTDFLNAPGNQADFGSVKCLDQDQLQRVVIRHIQRNDPEIADLQARRETNPLRAAKLSGREKELRALRMQEENEVHGGLFQAPALASRDGFRLCKAWDGTPELMLKVPFSGVTVADVPFEAEARFELGADAFTRKALLKKKAQQRHLAKATRSTKGVNPEVSRIERVEEKKQLVESRRQQLLNAKRGLVAKADAGPAASAEEGAKAEQKKKKKKQQKPAPKVEAFEFNMEEEQPGLKAIANPFL